MNKVLAVLMSIALTIIQLTITPMFKIGWLNYNFALVSIVIVCLLCGGKTGIVNAIVVAVIYDVFASKVLGTFVVLYLLIALLVELIAKHMFNCNAYIAVIFVFTSTLITEVLIYCGFYAFNGMVYNAFALSKIIFPQCLINSVVCLIVFWFYKSVIRLKRE